MTPKIDEIIRSQSFLYELFKKYGWDIEIVLNNQDANIKVNYLYRISWDFWKNGWVHKKNKEVLQFFLEKPLSKSSQLILDELEKFAPYCNYTAWVSESENRLKIYMRFSKVHNQEIRRKTWKSFTHEDPDNLDIQTIGIDFLIREGVLHTWDYKIYYYDRTKHTMNNTSVIGIISKSTSWRNKLYISGNNFHVNGEYVKKFNPVHATLFEWDLDTYKLHFLTHEKERQEIYIRYTTTLDIE